MKITYTHENKILVDNAKNLLEVNGIKTIIKNEYASSGMGELSAIDTWPELWVLDDTEFDKASQLIASLLKQGEPQLWTCGHCEETNESSFEVCWKCESEQSSLVV